MANDYKRFIVPLLFSVVVIITTLWVIQNLTRVSTNYVPAYDLIEAVDGTMGLDVNFLLLILLPIFAIECILLSMPFAVIMLVIAKIFRVATYNIDVMNIGHGFDWLRIMKRSVVPALFALSLGELMITLLQGVIFRIPNIPEGQTPTVIRSLHPLITILGALIALVVSLAVFVPTWLLNDSGIVAHVKPKYLELRRCPETEGVGRWYSNLVGGFGVLAFPITMFNRYFFQKFIVGGVPFELPEILVSLGWTIGLPFVLMAFIIPFIIFNELTISWTRNAIQRLARKMGATDVQLERVSKVKTSVDQEPVDPRTYPGSTEP